MAKRRLLYLAALVGCLIFYFSYRKWFSFLALTWVAALPWLSLLVSLPAMLTVSVTAACPARVQMGVPVAAALQIACRLPAPPVLGVLELHCCITGTKQRLKLGSPIPTEHCGMLLIEPKKACACDYLGLFRHRIRRIRSSSLLVEPVPVPVELPATLKARPVNLWRPKPGGGYAENHDLRLYRPGDSLRQIHWKVSAKTRKLIYREPMVPLRDSHVLTLTLCGTRQQLDQKLGKLVYLSRYLLQKQLCHEIRCLTGRGIQRYEVNDTVGLAACLAALLQEPAASQEQIPGTADALWSWHIGGDTDEA